MPFEFESRTFHNSGGEDGGGSSVFAVLLLNEIAKSR